MRRKNITVLVFIFIVSVIAITYIMAAGNPKVNYPEGYRKWTHVKSMVILPDHPLENPFGGIHHIYANEKALEGYKSGKFPKGSVIVFDLLKYKEMDNAIVEDERKLIGVMVKNPDKFAETGGWGFEGFAKDSKTERLTTDGGKSCFSCHQSQKENDYVFSKYRK